MNRLAIASLLLLLTGCSKTMPPTEDAFLKLKDRMYRVRASSQDVESFKKGDPATKVRMAELHFVTPLREEGYDFDQTVRRYCEIATQPGRGMNWHVASGMLSVWNELRPEFKAGGYLSASTLSLYSEPGVQAAIAEKEKMPNSEGSAAPQRAAGPRLNKPVSSED